MCICLSLCIQVTQAAIIRILVPHHIISFSGSSIYSSPRRSLWKCSCLLYLTSLSPITLIKIILWESSPYWRRISGLFGLKKLRNIKE